MRHHVLWLGLVPLLGGLSTVANAETIAKQLAGPPSEFAEIAPANPADSASFSRTALLPVELSTSRNGGASGSLTVGIEADAVRLVLLGEGSAAWDLELVSPSGEVRSARALSRDARQESFGIENASVPAMAYPLEGLSRGNWELRFSTRDRSATRGYVLIEGAESARLVSYPTRYGAIVGESVQFVAQLAQVGSKQSETLEDPRPARSEVQLRVTAPDGTVQTVAMADDGQHGDGLAGDGIYGGNFLTTQAGLYQTSVQYHGLIDGVRTLRSAEHVVPVAAEALRLGAARAAVNRSASHRFDVGVDIGASRSMDGRHFRAFAEVWGHDARGNALPVAWIGGMVDAADGQVDFGLDSRWIARAGAQGPFELRNVRLEDPDSYVTLGRAERVALDLPAMKFSADRGIGIDEEMLMGPRPAELSETRNTTRRLLLVHGYCSGGVWPASQFTNASTFLDANQNRTHDQFARLIRTFGSSWGSFGVVAHSQGGAASLHLYTYYWSGLDNAVGARRIQSVGTPYQGTNLSGILASLGSWFGVGCGTNNDLTYSGARAWLAGIPTSRRGAVNYYTTSFRLTNWWSNDYCQIATDLVLSDPEDGTTEQTYGQLPGAVNRGHVTGQCHTASMRDPAQFLDASRNSVMNTNAAR
ncbi:MAG: conditioned medium factor [Xanthomonadales bacterium]|jgi:hypothetical protein|nr:conditioned medium factor [Xanthomonadales bacterium]